MRQNTVKHRASQSYISTQSREALRDLSWLFGWFRLNSLSLTFPVHSHLAYRLTVHMTTHMGRCSKRPTCDSIPTTVLTPAAALPDLAQPQPGSAGQVEPSFITHHKGQNMSSVQIFMTRPKTLNIPKSGRWLCSPLSATRSLLMCVFKI